MDIFGVVTREGEHIDTSATQRGAKNYATRNGYSLVSVRYNCGCNCAVIAEKVNGRWREPTQ